MVKLKAVPDSQGIVKSARQPKKSTTVSGKTIIAVKTPKCPKCGVEHICGRTAPKDDEHTCIYCGNKWKEIILSEKTAFDSNGTYIF